MNKILTTLIAVLIAGQLFATTNEITVLTDLQVSKGAIQISKQPGNQVIQMVGTRFYSSVYSLTTTNQSMSKGAVGNLGWAYMRNLSAKTTNADVVVNISFDAGVTTNMQLLPTEAMVFRLAPAFEVTNIFASVAAGSGDFEFTVIEK
jgi:hypothetical protein